MLWGLSGTAAQVMFQQHSIQPQWLVAVRMAIAGAVLLAMLRPAFPRRQWRRLLVFALLGVAGVQLTYFTAIALSNVATATFLQFSSVAIIAAWDVLEGRSRMTVVRAAAIAGCLAGVVLLATGGSTGLGGLRVTPLGLVFGLLAAVAAAVYTVTSVPLVRGIGPWPTAAWGFALGSLPMLVAAPPWSLHASHPGPELVALLLFVILFGTIIAFGLYLASIRSLSPTQAGITSTVEPVAAALAAWAFLGVALLPLQYAGGAAILIAVVLLAREAAGALPATDRVAVQPASVTDPGS